MAENYIEDCLNNVKINKNRLTFEKLYIYFNSIKRSCRKMYQIRFLFYTNLIIKHRIQHTLLNSKKQPQKQIIKPVKKIKFILLDIIKIYGIN
jgi:hypothetical protein